MADSGGWSTIESDEVSRNCSVHLPRYANSLQIKGVFTSLIENLGVKGVQFEELISLDADTIRSLRFVSLFSLKVYQANVVSGQSRIRCHFPLQMDRRTVTR